jgi:hypothetical protein
MIDTHYSLQHIAFLVSPTELNTSARAVGTAMGKKAYDLKDVP